MPPPPAPSPSVSPAASPDPHVERLEAWWRDIYTLVARDHSAFRARLPALTAEIAENGPADPAEVAFTRKTMLWVAEGIAHWATCANEAAEQALRAALERLEQRLPRLRRPGLSPVVHRLIGTCHVYLGHVAHSRGDYPEAMRAYLHVRDIALLGNHQVMLSHGLAGISMIYGETAMWEKQLEYATEVRRIYEAINNVVAQCQLDVMVAHAYRKLRDFAGARHVLERTIEIFHREGWKGEELDAELRLAMLDQDEGRPAEALRRLRKAEALSAEVDRPHFEAARLVEIGRAHLALGDASAAAGVLRGVADRFAEVLGFPEQAEVQLLLARVHLGQGAFEMAARQVGQALELLARTSLPHEIEVEAHAVSAEIGRLRGDWESAWRAEAARREAYERHFNHRADVRARVLAVHHQIDMARATAERERIERQRLEQLLADLAARLQQADAAPRARTAEEIAPEDLRPLGLTARESEVLLWVARGKTNDEIAIILACGAETVKTHLKRIYQQLDVTNRAAAASTALQPPPLVPRRPTADRRVRR